MLLLKKQILAECTASEYGHWTSNKNWRVCKKQAGKHQGHLSILIIERIVVAIFILCYI